MNRTIGLLHTDSVRAYRGSINSHGAQANSAPRVPRVQLRVALAVARMCCVVLNSKKKKMFIFFTCQKYLATTDSCLTRPLRNREYVPCEEEIARYVAFTHFLSNINMLYFLKNQFIVVDQLVGYGIIYVVQNYLDFFYL